MIDVAPTLLEVARLPEPRIVHGVGQQPIEGVSMAYSFDDADAPERHRTQYFEILGSRGIYHEGWTAVAAHNPPVPGWPQGKLDDDVWELYDTNADWTQAHDLARAEPEKLRELQRLFLIEAARYNVLPLDDRSAERANPDTAGRPVLARGRPKYCYNFYGIDFFFVEAAEPLPEGEHLVRMAFDYDGGGVAKGGTVRLFIDDRQVGEGRVGRTQPLPFASDEPFEIGRNGGSPVTRDYSVDEFSGDVHWVELEIPEDAHDHDADISGEERLHAALVTE